MSDLPPAPYTDFQFLLNVANNVLAGAPAERMRRIAKQQRKTRNRALRAAQALRQRKVTDEWPALKATLQDLDAMAKDGEA